MHPTQGLQEDWTLETVIGRLGTDDSQDPFPDQKVQGPNPVVHWDKLQRTDSKQGGY